MNKIANRAIMCEVLMERAKRDAMCQDEALLAAQKKYQQKKAYMEESK